MTQGSVPEKQGVPIIGLMMSGIFAALAVIGYQSLYQLNKVDPGTTSYGRIYPEISCQCLMAEAILIFRQLH